MANKRDLKKYVEAMGASICEEMMIAYYNLQDINHDSVEKAIATILGAVEQARMNSNITFDKGMKAFESQAEYSKVKRQFNKSLFNKIEADFNAAIDVAVKEFNAAIPQNVKEANKSLAK